MRLFEREFFAENFDFTTIKRSVLDAIKNLQEQYNCPPTSTAYPPTPISYPLTQNYIKNEVDKTNYTEFLQPTMLVSELIWI